MRLVERAKSWLRTILRRGRMESEMDAELRFHVEACAEDLVRSGVTQAEARRRALIEFGGVESLKEECRDARGLHVIDGLVQDMRYGLRTLRHNPAFTAAAVVAIALGVGINVGIFSVLNGAALRLLPIPRAEQVVSVDQVFHGQDIRRDVHGETSMFSYPEYLDYRDHNHVFAGLVAYEPFIEATLSGNNMRQLLGTASSCNYFEVLHEHPVQGRGFVDSDCGTVGGNAAVVVSDDSWRSAFGADPSLIGRKITLNRTAFTVIGIAPPGFTGTEPIPSAFWVPITVQRQLDAGREYLSADNVSWLAMLGRLRDGVTLEQVRTDLGVIAGRIDERHPGRKTSLTVHRATFFSRSDERELMLPVISVVFAAFGLVLLIACSNVANLLLARASARQKEIALRISIGASRARLVRQLLTESLLLSLVAGALGSILAFWSFAGITNLMISHLPKEMAHVTLNVRPDLRVLGYALALTVGTGIMFGLVPALKSSRLDLSTALKGEGAPLDRGRGSTVLRNALVGAQIAICMILLLAAGLLLRGLVYAQTVDPGFDKENLVGAFVHLGPQGYDESRATTFIRSLRERVAGLPGVVDVAEAECAPLSHDFSADNFTVPGRADKVQVEYNHVSPEYFSTVGIPIVRGRGFTAAETRSGSTIVLTESTARRFWPGEDPLGKVLREDTGRDYSVVGVARDAQVSHLGDLATTYLYFPRGPEDNLRTYLMVRYAGNYASIASGIRDAVRGLDADVPIDVRSLEDYLEIWRMPSRIVAALAAGLGTLALLLAVIGVYGTVSYSVSRRVREIGIRMALGANRREVMGLVLRRAMRPVLIGAVIGVVGCAGVSRVLSGMLFGLSAHDPIAFVSGSIFLLVVAMIATYIPARRAMRVDPMVALRYE